MKRDHDPLLHTIKQLSTLETTLYSVLEAVKSKSINVAFFCREYWGTSASMAQLSIDELEWNDQLKPNVRQACVLESLGLAAVSQLSSGTMQDVSTTARLKIKNLLYYLHQNCNVLLDLVHKRWIGERGHTRLDFSILLDDERYRQLREGEHAIALRQHNEKIIGFLQPLCNGSVSKQVDSEDSNAKALLSSICDMLEQDPMRARVVRGSMLQKLRFQPLLSVDGRSDAGSTLKQDPYERFGKHRFGKDGTVVLYNTLPPMIPDLELNSMLPALERRSAGRSDIYTLVLDLDETLVHSSKESFAVRPGVPEFLNRMFALGYELVIFTTATQDYADPILDNIDPGRLIRHRLYRQHTLPWGQLFIKDLSRLGRDLERTLIIDNLAENFMMQPENGIAILSWYDDLQDQALSDLTPLLEELIKSRKRVSHILKQYSREIPVWAGLGESWRGPPMTPAGNACQQQAANVQFAPTFMPMVMQAQPQGQMQAFTTVNTSQAPMTMMAPAFAQQVMMPANAIMVPVQQAFIIGGYQQPQQIQQQQQ